MERVAAKLGHDSLTWRTVPTSNKSLGKSAVAVEPRVEQWFLSARGVRDNLDTEQQVGALVDQILTCTAACTGADHRQQLKVIARIPPFEWTDRLLHMTGRDSMTSF